MKLFHNPRGFTRVTRMGIVRTLLIAVAIFVALIIIKRLLAGRPPSPPAPPQTPKLVQCAHCGLHVDKAQALRTGDHYYCSADHQQRGGQK